MSDSSQPHGLHPGRSRLRECGRRAWRLAGLSSALACPLDLGARPTCRGLRAPLYANYQGLPHKNTGVGCNFLLQCMKVKSESEVAQSCPTLRNPMDCSLPGSSVHGIFQRRHSRVTTGISAFPLGWPWEAQSSPRVARESWGWRSSHCRA